MKKLLILTILVTALPAMAENDPAKLLDKKVSLNFLETKFSEVISYFAVFTKVDITVDPSLATPPPVTLAVDDISSRDALDLIVAQVDPKLGWDFRWGGIFIGMEDRLELMPQNVPGEAPGLDKRVNVDFAETALPQVVRFLGSFSGARIKITPEAMPRAKETLVSVKCNNASLRDALCRIVFPANLAWEIKDGVVRIIPAMTKKHESPEDAARRILAETRVNVDFEDTPIRDVANFFAQFAGIGIHLDPMLGEQRSQNELMVTLRADDITLKNALELICTIKSINYDFRWGGVFIAIPDRLKVLPKIVLAEPAADQPAWEAKLRRQLEGGVTFSFDGASPAQALDFIRTLKGVNIVMSPQARVKAESATSTCTVNEVRITDALALLLVPHGLKFELKNEVVLVSVAE